MCRTNEVGSKARPRSGLDNPLNQSNGLPDCTAEHRHRTVRLDGDTLQVRAAAKLNLTLSVGSTRPDGYHEFESLMATITLYDEVLLRPGGDGINLTCDDGAIPVGGENLVHRACTLLAGQSDTDADVDIELIKRIATQAGLGGGSADAAATLVGLNDLWKLSWSKARLARLAGMLGSDVPFFLSGPLAICRGRGEIVNPVDLEWPFWAVVVKPRQALSTAEVYRHYVEPADHRFAKAEAIARLLERSRPSQVADRLVNDLEAPAFRICGELGELRRDLERSINAPVRMTGSGSAMFALFDTREQAQTALSRIASSHTELTCWLVKNNSW